MPKVTKLHSTGKPKSLQKSTQPDGDQRDPEESLKEFQLQLLWCIQKLEKSIGEKKGNDKQLQEMWKVLTVLKNNNQPIIRKRQLMRKHLGDYRAKMAAEEKSLVKMANKIKIADNPVEPVALFLRKSASLSTGCTSFKFNFNVAQDKEENLAVEVDNIVEETEKVTLTENGDSHDSRQSIKNESKDLQQKTFYCSGSDFKFNFDVDRN